MTRKLSNVILDLDQTLISAEDPKSISKISKKKFDFLTENFEYHIFYDQNGKPLYYIFARPYLQEFLDTLFLNFNVAVWTAASPDYAMFVINHFILRKDKPERHLDFIYAKPQVDVSEKLYRAHKSLNYVFDSQKNLGYNSHNTVILDDNHYVFEPQKNHCVKAFPFEVKDRDAIYDNFLAIVAHVLWSKFKKGKLQMYESPDKSKKRSRIEFSA